MDRSDVERLAPYAMPAYPAQESARELALKQGIKQGHLQAIAHIEAEVKRLQELRASCIAGIKDPDHPATATALAHLVVETDREIATLMGLTIQLKELAA